MKGHLCSLWQVDAYGLQVSCALPRSVDCHHSHLESACWCMQVITSGLKEETVSVGECDECLTPAEQLLPRRQPQPKPGEPQVQAAPWTSHTLLP